jgi:hypothetical protein
VFEYGEGTLGNVSQFSRKTSPPINEFTVVGSKAVGTAEDAEQEEFSVTVRDEESIAKYGRFACIEQEMDVSDEATALEKAQGRLRPDPVRIVTFKPSPVSAPKPFDDFWLGDRVTFRAKKGATDINITPRVNKIDVDVVDATEDDYSIELEEEV